MVGKAFVNILWADRDLSVGCFACVGESKIIKTPINKCRCHLESATDNSSKYS